MPYCHPFFCPTPSWTASSPMICLSSLFSFSSFNIFLSGVPPASVPSQAYMLPVLMPCSSAISLMDLPDVFTRSSICFLMSAGTRFFVLDIFSTRITSKRNICDYYTANLSRKCVLNLGYLSSLIFIMVISMTIIGTNMFFHAKSIHEKINGW